MEVDRGFIYGKNQNTDKMVRLDRRSMAGGGHMMVMGDTGSGKTFFMKQEMVQILKESDDIIYIFTQNRWEYNALFSIKFKNMHYGERGSYEAILRHGRELLSEEKRIWVYFDQCFSDFTSDDWEEFLSFVRMARMAGVIITISVQDFSGIPSNILGSLVSCLECCQFFCIRNIASETLGLFVNEPTELVFMKEYLRNRIFGDGIFYSQNTGVIPISCRMKDMFHQQPQNMDDFLAKPNSKKDGFILGATGGGKAFFMKKEDLEELFEAENDTEHSEYLAKELHRLEGYIELQEQLKKEKRKRNLMIGAIAAGVFGAGVFLYRKLRK